MNKIYSRFSISILLLSLTAEHAFARKGSGMVYEDPFDRGAGGASLTRAAQAGILFANPALLPYGEGFHRWVGIEPTVMVGRDSSEFAQGLSSGNSMEPAELLDTLSKTPIHAGVSNAVSYMNRGFGIAAFNRFEPDLQVKKYGELGLPEVKFQAESYHGVAVSGAAMTVSRVLSFGVTGKYLYASETDLAVAITDQEKLKSMTSGDGMRSIVSHNTGVGFDAGAILFSQGYNVDWKMALKVDDIGDTQLSGDGTLKELPQTYSAGVATTLHNGVDALHLSLDYRDIQNAYDEKAFKRVRAGAKVMFRRYVGIGAGIYDGSAAYSAEVDLILLRITGAAWTKEMGDSPGVDPRPVYAIGLAMGF